MSIKASFIAELSSDLHLTRKMLDRVPWESRDWKPHPKSMSLGRLATHIAEIPDWTTRIIKADQFDFAARAVQPAVAPGTKELLELLENNVKHALDALSGANDEALDQLWTVKRGEHLVLQASKKIMIRSWAFSHLYHHRGQLSVFLRLLDIPVPGMFGPSADERK